MKMEDILLSSSETSAFHGGFSAAIPNMALIIRFNRDVYSQGLMKKKCMSVTFGEMMERIT